jgi:hypothetical protein
MTPYLTDEEIEHITDPLTQGAARIRYFREVLEVKVKPRPNGQPLVWRSDFDAARRREQEAANDGRPSLDWSAFEERVKYGRGEKAKRREPARA